MNSSRMTILLVLLGLSQVFGFSVTPNTRPASFSSALHMTVLTYNGKKKDFKAGSPLSKAVQQLGIKPRYSCKK